MDIVVVSRTLATLRAGECTTSSQLFELGLARALTQHARVSVLSLQDVPAISDANLTLVGLGSSRSGIEGIGRTIAEHDLLSRAPRRIIMWGYDPLMIGAVKRAAKRLKARFVSYVFDSHAGAIEHKPLLRRTLIDWYFRLGAQTLRFADGIIVLNPRAIPRLPTAGKPHLLSRVGIEERDLLSGVQYTRRSAQDFTIIYAGSLEAYNGVVPLVRALRFVEFPGAKLEIFGAGALSNQVVKLAANDNRITYRGLVAKDEVDRAVARADLLVNLRDLSHPVAAYSFPSKLIGYMASGIPVLSSRVLEHAEFRDLVNVVPALTPESIAAAISHAINSPAEQAAMAALARDFAAEHYRWSAIAPEVFAFLRELEE